MKRKARKRLIYKGESRLPSPELLALWACGWLGGPGRVVELGCGIASDALFLARWGWDAITVDSDRSQLRVVHQRFRRLGLRASRIQALAQGLPLRDGCADLILDRLLWNNVCADRHGAHYVMELCRIARAGTKLVVRAKTAWRGLAGYDPPPLGDLLTRRMRELLTSTFSPVHPLIRAPVMGDSGELVPALLQLFVAGRKKRPAATATRPA